MKFDEIKNGDSYEYKLKREFSDNLPMNYIYAPIFVLGCFMIFMFLLSSPEGGAGEYIFAMFFLGLLAGIPGFLLYRGIKNESIFVDVLTNRITSNKTDIEVTNEDQIEVLRIVQKSGSYKTVINGKMVEQGVGLVRQEWLIFVHKNGQKSLVTNTKSQNGFPLLVLAKSIGKKLNLTVMDNTTNNKVYIEPTIKETPFVGSITKSKDHINERDSIPFQIVQENRRFRVTIENDAGDLVLAQTTKGSILSYFVGFVILTGFGAAIGVMVISSIVKDIQNKEVLVSHIFFLFPLIFCLVFIWFGIRMLDMYDLTREYRFGSSEVKMSDNGLLFSREKFRFSINELMDVQILSIPPVYILEIETTTSMYPVECQFNISAINRVVSAINQYYS